MAGGRSSGGGNAEENTASEGRDKRWAKGVQGAKLGEGAASPWRESRLLRLNSQIPHQYQRHVIGAADIMAFLALAQPQGASGAQEVV